MRVLERCQASRQHAGRVTELHSIAAQRCCCLPSNPPLADSSPIPPLRRRRAHYGPRWKRPPSSQLTKSMRDKLNGYRGNLMQACGRGCCVGAQLGGRLRLPWACARASRWLPAGLHSRQCRTAQGDDFRRMCPPIAAASIPCRPTLTHLPPAGGRERQAAAGEAGGGGGRLCGVGPRGGGHSDAQDAGGVNGGWEGWEGGHSRAGARRFAAGTHGSQGLVGWQSCSLSSAAIPHAARG